MGWRSSCCERHEEARHQREVKRHVALVAVPEIGAHVGRPLVRFGQEHAIRVAGCRARRGSLEYRVRLRQVLAVRALALEEVRHRVEPQAVHAQVEPEPHDLAARRACTCGLSKFRSGWWRKKRCQ